MLTISSSTATEASISVAAEIVDLDTAAEHHATAVPQWRQSAKAEINGIVATEHGEGGSNAWIEECRWQSLELMGLWHAAERMEGVETVE